LDVETEIDLECTQEYQNLGHGLEMWCECLVRCASFNQQYTMLPTVPYHSAWYSAVLLHGVL
jgi:hypothetical protein